MAEVSTAKTGASQSANFASMDSLAFLQTKPQLTATLKQEFEDFRVDEELGFEFTEQGEHVSINVKKIDLSTVEVVKRLSEVSGVRRSAIGYAGMKDKRGECTQWFSVQLPLAQTEDQQRRILSDFENSSLQILESHRNSRKIRIGSHKSNKFAIRLRDCAGSRAEFENRLAHIKENGVPNYFGAQRFGQQMSNMPQVQQLMESALNNEAVEGRRFKRGMLFSAARSYLFNQLLSYRLQANSWNTYISGYVLNLNGTDRCFVLGSGEDWDQTLQQRLEQFDIHISGLLPGLIEVKDKYVSSGESADIEDAVCEQYGTLLAGLKHYGVAASRRALRFLPINFEWRWLEHDVPQGVEREQRDLILQFSLPKGAYATSLLRELCVTT